MAFLYPHPGLGGFALLRGTAAQIDSLRREEEYEQLIRRVRLIVDGLEVIDASVDEGLAKDITAYLGELKKL